MEDKSLKVLSTSLAVRVFQMATTHWAIPIAINRSAIRPMLNYPAFSSSIGSVRLCFFTISAVIESSLTFLLPGT